MFSQDAKPTRGEETRKKLMDAGLHLYATVGYSAVTTRRIAQEAGVSHSAIGFHFRGKEGLYQAVLNNMIQTISRTCRAFTSHIEAHLDSFAGDRSALRHLVNDAVQNFVKVSIETHRSRWMVVLIQREFVDPSGAFERIYAEVGEPFLKSAQRLVRLACPEDSGNTSRIKACCILSQLTSLGRDREILNRSLDADIFSPGNAPVAAEVVAKGVCGILEL
jgi:AcrR family transcriptional regulator